MILTARRREEGGKFAGDERERIQLLSRLGTAGFAFLDLEEDLEAPELEAGIRKAGVSVIRSFYDTQGVPPDLVRKVVGLARDDLEIPKAAVTPRGAADLIPLLEAFNALKHTQKVLVGMGPYGFPTRVLAQKLGSLFCYSSAGGVQAAPGHIDPQRLDELYRYRLIGNSTKVFGVIGNPVMHSLSPKIHNAGFTVLGLDAVYLPLLVDELTPFFQVADGLDIQGLSITIPHKETIVRMLERRDQSVEAIGACNTIRRSTDGTWEGTNTDAAGFLAPLLQAFEGRLPQGLRATVLGAGGASRAVVYALLKHGARVLVLNRTADRAQRLVQESGGAGDVQSAPLDSSGMKLMVDYADLIVQTTKVGMSPDEKVDPLPGYEFTGRETVYDLVYVPKTTQLLKRAIAAGCRVVRGGQMLLAQAFEQFRFFTGRDYPPEARDNVLDLITD
jgi:3-dehydroquinate dehydratase/shikimate dehydrogenase